MIWFVFLLFRWGILHRVLLVVGWCQVLYSVQFSRSVVSDSATPWIAACQATLSITNSQSLPKLMSIELVMPSNISTSVVPFSSCPQSFPASGSFQMSQFFASGGQSIRVFQLQHHSFKWTFRTDLLAVQRTLKSLLLHHSSEASIIQLSAFFIVQLSHPYMTTGKTKVLTKQTFVGKVMSAF